VIISAIDVDIYNVYLVDEAAKVRGITNLGNNCVHWNIFWS